MDATPLNIKELILAGEKNENKKAVGLDDIQPNTVKTAMKVATSVSLKKIIQSTSC